MSAFVEVGERARQRFVRWDAALWDELSGGPFAALADTLGPDDPALDSYVRLAAEAVGRGTLFPARSGARTFMSRAFTELLPAWLPALPPDERASVIARVFNLGENLEKVPRWVQRLLEAQLAPVQTPHAMDAIVEATMARLTATPTDALGDRFALRWVSMAETDPRFLPGPVCFLAPLVGMVRARGGDDAYVLWLGDAPEVLGPGGWPDDPERELPEDARLEAWRASDARFTGVYDAALNPHRGLATLATSQLVVVVTPS